MPVTRFVAFHSAPETSDGARRQTFAVMLAHESEGVVLVYSRHRKVWELPGGLVDAGETPRQAAERELVEESGCQARKTRWLGIMEVSDGNPYFGAVFRCEVDAVPAHFENEETGGITIWRRNLAPQPLGQSDAELLARFG